MTANRRNLCFSRIIHEKFTVGWTCLCYNKQRAELAFPVSAERKKEILLSPDCFLRPRLPRGRDIFMTRIQVKYIESNLEEGTEELF